MHERWRENVHHMTNLEVALVVVVSVWLVLLTVLVLAILRQVGLVTLRLNRLEPISAISGGHLVLAAPVDQSVIDALPALASGVHYLIWLSASCMTCRDVARELGTIWEDAKWDRFRTRTYVVISGSGQFVDQMISMLPREISPVLEPQASVIPPQLGLPGSPFAVAIGDGAIRGWTALQELRNLDKIAVAEPVLDEAEASPGTTEEEQAASSALQGSF